jgi:hypothetical protein
MIMSVMDKQQVTYKSVTCLLIMVKDIKEIFMMGGLVVALLYAGLIWFPNIRASAGDPSASVDVVSNGIIILIYSVLPASELAIYVDLAVAAIASLVSVESFNSRGKGIIFAAGAGWVLANMIMTAIFPPV